MSMTQGRANAGSKIQRSPPKAAMAKGTIAIIVALLVLLVGTVAFAAYVWRSLDMALPAYAWGTLAAGAFFSVLVGGGLMALVFYSSRLGYDEPAHLIDQDR